MYIQNDCLPTIKNPNRNGWGFFDFRTFFCNYYCANLTTAVPIITVPSLTSPALKE